MRKINTMDILIMRNLLSFFMLVLSLGGITIGISLIVNPDGSSLNLTLGQLYNSLFPTYLIPGIIILLLNGILPFITIYGIFGRKRKNKLAEALNIFPDMHWGWTFSIYCGLILLISIQTQMSKINEILWLHDAYFLVGILIIFTALSTPLRKYYADNE